jgi:WD40 repeat protein
MHKGFDLFVWDVARGKLIARLSDGSPPGEAHTPARAVAFSPDDRRALVVNHSGEMLLWDVEKRTLVQRWQLDANLASVAISPDGKYALCGCGITNTAFLFRLPP